MERCRDNRKAEEIMRDKSRLERKSEEHWTLVAGQVFQAWTGDCPRRSYQSSLARNLTPGGTAATEVRPVNIMGCTCNAKIYPI